MWPQIPPASAADREQHWKLPHSPQDCHTSSGTRLGNGGFWPITTLNAMILGIETTTVLAGMSCCARRPLTAGLLWSAKCLLWMPAAEAHLSTAATEGPPYSSESQAPVVALPVQEVQGKSQTGGTDSKVRNGCLLRSKTFDSMMKYVPTCAFVTRQRSYVAVCQ